MRESQYKKMIDLLEQYQPKRICELGCGQSTLIYEQYCEKYNAVMYSIEHDPHYKRKDTIIFNLLQNTRHTCEGHFFGSCNRYDGMSKWLRKQEPFDFISVDGPPGWGFRQKYQYGRVQLVNFPLCNKVAQKCIVLVHDTQRKNMQRTLKAFEDILKQKKLNFTKEQDKQRDQLTVYKII